MDKLIWTPEFGVDYRFDVYLDRNFAKKMIQAEVSPERQRRLSEMANQYLKDKGARFCSYYFHEGSGFVTQFNVFQGGVWLATDIQNIESLLKGEECSSPVKYDCHNVDHVYQAYTLMAMVDLWVKYANILTERSTCR